jgi:membrane protein implicated in regulation of membrane protease activity
MPTNKPPIRRSVREILSATARRLPALAVGDLLGEAGVAMYTVQSLQTDDATVTGIPTDRPEGALLTMVILPAIGVVLVLVGLALFLVDLSVTNHGLPTAGGILALLGGGLALVAAGVPYAGVLLGALGIVAVLMGGALFGVLGTSRALRGRPAMTGREGMIGEVGTVRSPVGVDSEGWVFVHGERWRAVLAFAPEETDPRDHEAVVGVGRKVAVVGFGEGGGVVEVVPVELPHRRHDLDLTG